MDKKIMTIETNTQITFHDLRVGVGNFGIDPNATGRDTQSAVIWPFLRNEETGRPSVLVHEGDVIDLDVYQLKILNISQNTIKIQFILKVQDSE